MTTHASQPSNELISIIDDILLFWFGTPNEHGFSDEAIVKTWWKKDPAFDEIIRSRFAEIHHVLARGDGESWLKSTRGRLAYLIVLDQFSRNMFRDSAIMFSFDAQARRAALEGIEEKMDREVFGDQRAFYYLPLMHSERLDDQNRCVDLFQSFYDELTENPFRERIGGNLKFAIAHRDIIARWGRFPHRNNILGRTSTIEELEFLKQPGSSF